MKKQANVSIPNVFGDFMTIAYSTDKNDRMPHIVLLNEATQLSGTVNVRIHSECMTGDVFGSFRCECGEQLSKAMEYVAEYGGLVIYLRQEGRGIGIINKLHAYQKQDEGYDTAEANRVLGFGYDDRTYEDAVAILNDLGVTSINLITNNPSKIEALEHAGINVENRIAIHIEPKKENKAYLRTKKEKFGHQLDMI